MMENISLTELWKAQNAKLERSLQLNLFLLNSLQKDKAKSKLDKLARFKSFAVVLGVIWGAFLGVLIYGNQFSNLYFEVSVIIIFLFNLYACIAYIRQIHFIKKLDYSDSVLNTQKKLASLQVSTINTTGVLMLQLPFYTTWFYTHEQVLHDHRFQLISFTSTFIFALIGIWLYRNIHSKNIHKKWLRSFMNVGPEYSSITEARDFLSEIEAFQSA
ncbi:hypothetical protein [Ferruginibacter sp.]